MNDLIIKVLSIVEFCFAFSLFVTAGFTANECLAEPCFEGPGIEAALKINTGLSFQIISTAIAFGIHSAWLFFNGITPLIVGATSVMSLISIQTVFIWNSWRLIIRDWRNHYVECYGQTPSQKKIRGDLFGTFNSALAFSVLIMVISWCELFVMWLDHRENKGYNNSNNIYAEPIDSSDIYNPAELDNEKPYQQSYS